MTFEQAIEHVLAKEGGFTANPKDSGNWTGGAPNSGSLKGTKYGISAAAYPKLDIRNLTRERAIEIYRHDYWDRLGAEELPQSIRLHVFDMAVNAGIGTAIRLLQSAGGVSADGVLGPRTLAAAQRVTPWMYAEARSTHYIELARKRPKDITFLLGWIRRVLQITKISLEA